MHRHARGIVFVCGLLIAMVFAVSLLEQTTSNTQLLVMTPTPTEIPVLATSVAMPTSTITSILPDHRIQELRDKYGIELANQYCVAPCFNAVKGVLTLGELVEKLGAPEKVFLSLDNPERPQVLVSLVYASKGIIVGATRPLSDNANMTPDMKVYRIDLWNARNLNDLKTEIEAAYKIMSFPLEKAQNWNGFGPVRPLPR